MIGTIDVCPQTYSPDFPLDTLKSFVNSPSSIRIRNVPKKVGKWRITNVFVTVAYPDNTTRTIECVLTGGVYVATFEGCSSTGKVEKGLTISANGKDENDNDVTGYILGKGDVEILEARENTSPGETVYYIHLLEDEPDVPTDGDMYKKDGNYVVYQNGVETQLGVSQENMESYVDQKVEEVEGEIPTKTSDLTNDSNFITSEQVEPSGLAGLAKKAYYSYYLVRTDGINEDVNTYLTVKTSDNDKGVVAAVNTSTYESWFLSEYNGSTFNPPIELKWGYCESVYVYVTIAGRRVKRTKNINSNAWFVQLEEENYVIRATNVSNVYVPVDNIIINNTEHPVTYTTTYKTEIATIDGQSGVITCTRNTSVPIYPSYGLAYNDELPTKTSELTNDSQYVTTTEVNTALALKQDKLSEPQINSINSNVDDNKTVVYYDNIEPRIYDIYGTMNVDDISVEGSNITNIKIGRGVITLGTELFMNSPLMTSIELPDSLKHIDTNAFTTSNIDSLVIPDSVETINAYAFSSAHAVSITVGSGVETIGQGAFDNCNNLTSLVFKGKTLAEVQSMTNYPWSISDTSIIKTFNVASKEWVEERLAQLLSN